MRTIRTRVRLLFRMRPLVGVVLCLRCRSVVTETALVFLLSRMRRLVILQLFFRAECSFAMGTVVSVVAGMGARDVSVEFTSMFERCIAAQPSAYELLCAKFGCVFFLNMLVELFATTEGLAAYLRFQRVIRFRYDPLAGRRNLNRLLTTFLVICRKGHGI